MANNKKPVAEVKLGSIRAAVWSNKSEDGRTWFQVTIARLYKDGDQWKDSASFRRDDLPLVMKVADLALSWILAEQAKLGHEPEAEE
jgi:hypothetical protein